MQIFKENFETGTTSMLVEKNNGEVILAPENPVAGNYSARCRAFFSPNTWTSALLRHNFSPIPEAVFESLLRLDIYNRRGIRVLFIRSIGGMIFNFGIDDDSRMARLYIIGVGFVDVPRYLNVGETYHIKVHLKCASARGVADGAVTVWVNNEVIYENTAIDNSEYGLLSGVSVGCASWWATTSTVEYAEVSIDEISVNDTLQPPEYHVLSIDSNVTGVKFTLNDIEKTTPYSEELQEGTYNSAMPSEVAVGTDVYRFVRWNDGNTNPIRTILLNTNISLTAEYELYTPPLPPATHRLTIDSTPIQGIPFTIERVS